jgi:predicted KAP-like P-loop ATPase
MDDLPHNDQPIGSPSQDRFGIDPFAIALAKSITKLKSPNGSVIALNGPWGSGKSSALNLIRHHLGEAIKSQEIVVINFACWWFRGEEALALAFFRELYAGLSPTIGTKLKKSLPKLGARFLRAGPALGGAVDVAGGAGIGAAAGATMEWLSGLIEQEESVEKLHQELSTILAGQQRRFLIVIDDIDRLSPDEALLIFRLVKSVGRLPNVIYLLVYDRQLAEKIVSERFPSEGPHYLEKIVQAAFEIPEPLPSDLHNQLFAQFEAIFGPLKEDSARHFMNLFYGNVAPEIRTPRDVTRLLNSLSVAWPAVEGEVDLGDFVALETLRLRHPQIHRALRQNKDKLFNISPHGHYDKKKIADDYDKLLLRSIVAEEREHYRHALMRLFPSLGTVWGNNHYGSDFSQRWASERRVCSVLHFYTYFRFAIGNEILSVKELGGFIQRIAEENFVVEELRNAVKVERPSGGTKAAVLLSELTNHAGKIDLKDVQPLLTALFSVADDIDVEADVGKGFSLSNNHLRLHWLLRSLTLDRMSLTDRSTIFVQACQTAPLGWLVDFTESAWGDYYPRENKQPEPESNCLTTRDDAELLRNMSHQRITEAATNSSLLNHKNLAYLLYRWADLIEADDESVKSWTAAQVATDEGVEKLAMAFTSYSWSQALGDYVARSTVRAQVKGLDRVLDVSEFRKRVEHVASAGDKPEVKQFLEAWQKQDLGHDD